MKKILIFSVAIMMFSCGEKKNAKNEQEQIVGADRDEHNCIGSAGQTWSELRGECLQIFNEGKRLNPIEQKKGEAVISAFVLFDEDKSRAEVFLPSLDNEILSQTGDNIYENDTYHYNDSTGILTFNGKETYKAE